MNYALSSNGATASASSIYDAGRLPVAAINGDRKGIHWGTDPSSGSGWHCVTNNTYPDWLQVDFADSKTITEINVVTIQDNYANPVEPTEAMTFTTYGMTAFEAQYWNGSAWVTVPGGSVTGNNKVWRQFTFTPVTTNKIRVLVNNALAGYSRIVEVEAWSDPTATGLRGYWKFDENTGTTAADASGSGNTGTLTSGAGWSTGQSGAAVNLDGVNDYVQVGAQSSLVLTTAASISAWIYPTGPGSNSTYGGIIVNKEGEYELARYPNGTIQWAFANSNPGWNFINTGYVAPLNQWTHLAVTYDNGTIKTYANGNLVHSYQGAGAIGDAITGQNDFRIGGRQALSQHFQGRLDEVRIYNRAVSADEVSVLQNLTANIKWLVADHLGTPRMVFDKSGSLAGTRRHDYLAFGEEWFAGMGGRTTGEGYVADGVRQKFTLKERDIETGLDYFLARYYSSTQGRFTSVDPYNPILHSEDATDFISYLSQPQNWNRYGYALNNPLKYVDPFGQDVVLTGSEADQKEALERLRNQLGEERFNLLDFNQQNIEGLGNVTVVNFGSQENQSRFAAIGGDNAYEVEFSQGMADIIGSSEHVEYRLASTFQANSCILSVCETVTKTTAEFGGAATLNKNESLTGNVQIFVSRNATTKAFENMELRRQWGVRISSDGDALTFTPEQIDAHEFGHAHNVIKFGMRAEPSYRANRWENILRHRQRSSNTRIVH